MAKKKVQAITYLGSPQILPQQIISQIPNYENSGVKYQGWYKKDLGGGNFELRQQITRFITVGIGNGAIGSTLFTRPNNTKKFYCTKAFIQFHALSSFSISLAQMRIADVSGIKASTKLYFYPTHADGECTIDFSDCPRVFQGDSIDLYSQYSLGATEFILFSLLGWEED